MKNIGTLSLTLMMIFNSHQELIADGCWHEAGPSYLGTEAPKLRMFAELYISDRDYSKGKQKEQQTGSSAGSCLGKAKRTADRAICCVIYQARSVPIFTPLPPPEWPKGIC